MLAFILQRLIQAVIVMVTVAFVAFLLFQYVGDPVVFLLGQDATKEQIDQLRGDLGLDQPFFIQFGHFLYNAVQGEFGLSLRQGAKVSRLIAERFPATLELALVAAGLALLIGIPMGVYAALRRGTFMSQLFMTLSLLGVSWQVWDAQNQEALQRLAAQRTQLPPLRELAQAVDAKVETVCRALGTLMPSRRWQESAA